MGTGDAIGGSPKTVYLPFAGITLFRFNGYISAGKDRHPNQHPEDDAKLVFFFILRQVTFNRMIRFIINNTLNSFMLLGNSCKKIKINR